MMDPTSPPLLSAILATSGGLEEIRHTLRFLRAQTILSRIELVVVSGSDYPIDGGSPLFAGFHSVHPCRIPEVKIPAIANATGVRHASAEYVVFCEDHCFPDPEWAENLVKAFEAGADVACPRVLSANSGTAMGQVDFLISYARWDGGPCPGREDFLAGHQSAYRKELLLAEGEALPHSLHVETVFQMRLRREGKTLRWCRDAVTRHTNFSRLPSAFAAQFYASWAFAAQRSWHWGIAKRLIYAAASLLLPGLRGKRLLELWSARQTDYLPLPRLVPPLLALLAANALGEALGTLYFVDEVKNRLGKLEHRRWNHITPSERAQLFPA